MYNYYFIFTFFIIIFSIYYYFYFALYENFQINCRDNGKYGVDFELTFNNPYIYYNKNTDIIPIYTVFNKTNNPNNRNRNRNTYLFSYNNNNLYTQCFIGRKVYLGYINGFDFPLYFYITELNSKEGYNGYILDQNGLTIKNIIPAFNSTIPIKLSTFTTKKVI